MYNSHKMCHRVGDINTYISELPWGLHIFSKSLQSCIQSQHCPLRKNKFIIQKSAGWYKVATASHKVLVKQLKTWRSTHEYICLKRGQSSLYLSSQFSDIERLSIWKWQQPQVHRSGGIHLQNPTEHRLHKSALRKLPRGAETQGMGSTLWTDQLTQEVKASVKLLQSHSAMYAEVSMPVAGLIRAQDTQRKGPG